MAQLDTLEVIPIADSAIINLMHHFEKNGWRGIFGNILVFIILY